MRKLTLLLFLPIAVFSQTELSSLEIEIPYNYEFPEYRKQMYAIDSSHFMLYVNKSFKVYNQNLEVISELNKSCNGIEYDSQKKELLLCYGAYENKKDIGSKVIVYDIDGLKKLRSQIFKANDPEDYRVFSDNFDWIVLHSDPYLKKGGEVTFKIYNFSDTSFNYSTSISIEKHERILVIQVLNDGKLLLAVRNEKLNHARILLYNTDGTVHLKNETTKSDFWFYSCDLFQSNYDNSGEIYLAFSMVKGATTEILDVWKVNTVASEISHMYALKMNKELLDNHVNKRVYESMKNWHSTMLNEDNKKVKKIKNFKNYRLFDISLTRNGNHLMVFSEKNHRKIHDGSNSYDAYAQGNILICNLSAKGAINWCTAIEREVEHRFYLSTRGISFLGEHAGLNVVLNHADESLGLLYWDAYKWSWSLVSRRIDMNTGNMVSSHRITAKRNDITEMINENYAVWLTNNRFALLMYSGKVFLPKPRFHLKSIELN